MRGVAPTGLRVSEGVAHRGFARKLAPPLPIRLTLLTELKIKLLINADLLGRAAKQNFSDRFFGGNLMITKQHDYRIVGFQGSTITGQEE